MCKFMLYFLECKKVLQKSILILRCHVNFLFLMFEMTWPATKLCSMGRLLYSMLYGLYESMLYGM